MRKKLLKSSAAKRLGVVATIGAVAAGAYFLLQSGNSKPFPVPVYTVARVIDGDTFVTTEKQIVRVASIEAPELDQCGGPEAKKALEKLVMGKAVYFKVMYRDPYQRLDSLVYTSNTFVNEEMLENGTSYYYRRTPGEIGQQLKEANERARKKKVGIFSTSCTQMTNKAKPSCNVKGNTRNGNIYYTSDCGMYNNVEVQLYLGDRWFCSEKEAKAAGFRKPSQCP